MRWCSKCAKNTEHHHDISTWVYACVDCGKVVIPHDYVLSSCDRNKKQQLYPVKEREVYEKTVNVWCSYCLLKCDTYHQDTTHYMCCVHCGEVVSENLGIFLKAAENLITQLVDEYRHIVLVRDVTKYFQLALTCGFITRGRRLEHVAVACFYLACREIVKPILLTQFAYDLGVNVYKLAVLYLQLCELFGLQDHPVVQNLVDPTFFMHRYTSVLMKDNNDKKVWSTALILAVCMKRDWIRTGRQPSGIYAAAIYVSSMFHGYNFSKTDVVEAVQRCEATLSKRLIEFKSTESGSITIEELSRHAMDFDLKMLRALTDPMEEVVCEHKSSAPVQIGFGLCEDCYLEFRDRSEPPSFQPGEIIREKIYTPGFAYQIIASKKAKPKRKRELEAKPVTLAACQQFKKKLSSKINYDAWTRLFGDEELSQLSQSHPEKNVNDSIAKGNEIRRDGDDCDDNGNDDDCDDNGNDDDCDDNGIDDDWDWGYDWERGYDRARGYDWDRIHDEMDFEDDWMDDPNLKHDDDYY